MKPYLYAFLFATLWMACTNRNSLPSGIMPQEKMQELVWDIMIVDEYAREALPMDTLKNKNIKKERSILYQQVFDLHKTSREDFLKSFKYYTTRPDLTKILYDTLAIRGSRKREEAFRVKNPK